MKPLRGRRLWEDSILPPLTAGDEALPAYCSVCKRQRNFSLFSCVLYVLAKPFCRAPKVAAVPRLVVYYLVKSIEKSPAERRVLCGDRARRRPPNPKKQRALEPASLYVELRFMGIFPNIGAVSAGVRHRARPHNNDHKNLLYRTALYYTPLYSHPAIPIRRSPFCA